MPTPPRRARLPAHGTRERYQHRREPCHCDVCREANARYIAERRSMREEEPLRGVVELVNDDGDLIGEQHPLWED